MQSNEIALSLLRAEVLGLQQRIAALEAKVDRLAAAHNKLNEAVRLVIDALKDMAGKVKWRWFA